MEVLAGIVSILLIALILWDGFTNVVLPRARTRRLRLSNLFYRFTWMPWMALVRRIRNAETREGLLGIYGPFSSIMLMGLWATGLIFGFAGFQWSLGSDMSTPEGTATFGSDLYMSGVTFFTLGYGDVVPHSGMERFVAIAEAGIGFGFLAIIIGYIPVLYQSYARRETLVSMLDARAGSPPSATELLRRLYRWGDKTTLDQFLSEWEVWVSEVMESQLSHPVLSFYRSHHHEHSWVAALTTVLDTCALVMAQFKDVPEYEAHLTFSLAQHAAVDLCAEIEATPHAPAQNRLPPDDLKRLRAQLAEVGVILSEEDDADMHLTQLRRMYEPYVNGLADALCLSLPPWISTGEGSDLWRKRLKRNGAIHHH